MQLTAAQLDQQVNSLYDAIAQYLPSPEGTRYYAMLHDLEADAPDTIKSFKGEDLRLLGMRRAPAAKGNHHAFEGGWCYHILEMLDLWERMRIQVVTPDDHLTDARILKGIINHDLHKVWRTYGLVSADPWQCVYAEDNTDKLLEASIRGPQGVFKSLFMLQRHGIQLDEIDFNVVINSEGGFGKTNSYWDTVVAKMVYLLDELSGNVVGRQASGRWLGHNQVVEAPKEQKEVPSPPTTDAPAPEGS